MSSVFFFLFAVFCISCYLFFFCLIRVFCFLFLVCCVVYIVFSFSCLLYCVYRVFLVAIFNRLLSAINVLSSLLNNIFGARLGNHCSHVTVTPNPNVPASVSIKHMEYLVVGFHPEFSPTSINEVYMHRSTYMRMGKPSTV